MSEEVLAESLPVPEQEATAGSWVALQFDGTNWIVMMKA